MARCWQAADCRSRRRIRPTSRPTGTQPVSNPNLSDTYLVSEAGAVVDVSGVSETSIEVLNAKSKIIAPTTSTAWSNAGTVSINAGAFVWGGAFRADTDPRATDGGTLILGGAALASGAATSSITLQQDSTALIAKLSAAATPTIASMPSQAQLLLRAGLTAASPIVAAVDKLAPFGNVFLYSGTSVGGASRIFTSLPGSAYGQRAPTFGDVVISGNLDWTVANRLHIAARTITSAAQNSVSIAAPYVLLTGAGGSAAAGDSTITVRTGALDIEGAAFSRFKQVNLISSGDIRLSTPRVADGVGQTNANDPWIFTGQLTSSGNLLMDARRIYPVSAVNFTIRLPATSRSKQARASTPKSRSRPAAASR